MIKSKILRRLVLLELMAVMSLAAVCLNAQKRPFSLLPSLTDEVEEDYIKWVDFDVTAEALARAYEYDVNTHDSRIHLNWIELLAYTAAHTGGSFSKEGEVNGYLDGAAEALLEGKSMEELAGELKYYDYYLEAYTAVLGGLVGEYRIQKAVGEGEDTVWESRYGLKAFHPIAKGFPYSEYDDFGVSRSYGYKRQHLGHDLMGQTGTPIIAVESGTVEALGWNQYGGWRIGIRSFDQKRYYYYAHLRKGFPYALDLEEGSMVQAGDVIGYMGRTGYSATEDVNNIDEPHLHFGIQLIFDESQQEGNGEIWIDCYELLRFLYRNRSECVRNDETKEWSRKYQMTD